MAGRRQIEIDEQGYPIVDFYFPYNLYEHFNDEAEFVASVNEAWERYDQVKGMLRHGEPNPLDKRYPEGTDDRRYQSDLRMWEQTMSMDAVLKANTPPPQPGPVDRDFLALSSRDEKDRQMGAEILRHRQFIDEQVTKAVEYRSMGNEEKAREAESRAGMMTRQIQKTRRERKYSFIEERDKQLEEGAIAELERAMDLSPSEVEAKREYFQGLITAFNATSGENFSFVIDGPSAYDPNRTGEIKITKVVHDPFRSCDIARLAENTGQCHLDTLLKKGYGMTNPKAEAEEKPSEEETPPREVFEASLKPL